MIYLQFAVVGLGLGAVYAGLGLGVVVVYTGTGVLNFAQGAMAMWGAYVFYQVETTGTLVLPVGSIPLSTTNAAVAVLAGLGSSALVGAFAYLLVFRPLRRAPVLARIVASLGLLLTLQSLVVIRFGSAPAVVNSLFPATQVSIGSLMVSQAILWVSGITVLLAVVLWLLLRFTRLGLALRAASENEQAAELLGYSPQRLGALSWIGASVLTGLVAILTASFAGLNALDYTLFIVPALAAALVGRMTSVALVTVAGLLFGSIESELTFFATKSWWPTWAATGASDVFPLLVIVVVLFVTGRRLPSRGERVLGRLPAVSLPRMRPAVSLGLLGVGALAIFVTSGSYRFGVVITMIYAVIALSLVLLTGYAGQVSLAQAALAGAGGYILSRLATAGGIGFPWSLILATLGAGAIGLVIAVPALRIRGMQLTVVTLAMALAVQDFVFDNPQLSPANGNPVPPARFFGLSLAVRAGSDIMRWQFGIFVLVVVAAVFVVVTNLMRSDTGRTLVALRSNERAAAAVGVSVTRAKLGVFAIASLLAGLAGGLIGYSQGTVSADSFGALVGIEFLAFAYLGGITSLGGAVAAGLFAPLGLGYTVLTQGLGLNGGDYYLMVSGLLLLTTSVFAPGGVAREWRRTAEGIGSAMTRLAERRSPRARSAANVQAAVIDQGLSEETEMVQW